MSFWSKFKDFLFKDIDALNRREQSRKRARDRKGRYVADSHRRDADDKSTKVYDT